MTQRTPGLPVISGPRSTEADAAIRREVDFRHRVRLNRMQQECVREKIRATALVARLQAFVLGRRQGKKEVVMSDAQVRAAFGLLAKCVPDLHRVEHKGLLNNPLGAQAANVLVLATQSPAEAARAYMAMVNGDDSFDPASALPGEFSESPSSGSDLPAELPQREEVRGARAADDCA
jgi:hypothetical protein